MNPAGPSLSEEGLDRLMREATRDLDVPVDRLVAEGLRRGTVLRRRRRIAQVVGAIGASAAVVVTGSALLPAHDSGMVPAASPTDAVAPAVPSASQPGDRFGVSVSRMALTLSALLPVEGNRTELRSWTNPKPTGGAAPLMVDGVPLQPVGSEGASTLRAGSLVFDDGVGASAISISVVAPDPGDRGASSDEVQSLCADDAARCRSVTAGRLVVLEETSESARGGTEGVVSSSAILLADDGYMVIATSYNAPAEKGAAPTRDHPAFDGPQLSSIVTDPVWLA